jgi:hypothetical protein
MAYAIFSAKHIPSVTAILDGNLLRSPSSSCAYTISSGPIVIVNGNASLQNWNKVLDDGGTSARWSFGSGELIGIVSVLIQIIAIPLNAMHFMANGRRQAPRPPVRRWPVPRRP